MSNITVIFAGGTGQRMNSRTKPKQFLELHGKPILAYTLEHFQNHPLIDGVIIVMLESWIPQTKNMAAQYGYSKIVSVIPGGETGFLSRLRGVRKASELYAPDSVVLMHDGVRPLIDRETISRAVERAAKDGSAIVVAPSVETIALTSDGGKVGRILDRSVCHMVKAPQCFRLGDLLEAHERAYREKMFDCIDTASLMQGYGYSLYTVECGQDNIKITTPTDFFSFRAMLEARENSQLYGLS